MGAGITLLFYLCVAPVEPSRAMSCVARQVTAADCATALALVEAGMEQSRTWFAAACIATPTSPQTRPAHR